MTKRQKKKSAPNSVLHTWKALNQAMQTAREDLCHELLNEELTGRRRKRFLMRIQSRLNRLEGAAALKEVAAKAIT